MSRVVFGTHFACSMPVIDPENLVHHRLVGIHGRGRRVMRCYRRQHLRLKVRFLVFILDMDQRRYNEKLVFVTLDMFGISTLPRVGA